MALPTVAITSHDALVVFAVYKINIISNPPYLHDVQ